jgi:parallel beta-helix repeat protein
MSTKKKSVKLEKAISILSLILCLLSISPSGFKLSAKADSNIVTVNPSESIQAAINNATTTGSTILVRAGTYQESLVVNKSISLIGDGREQTIIDGQNNQFIINITADNVVIEGFTIRSDLSPDSGISMFSSKGDAISHNTVENSQQGIVLQYSSNNVISNNIITANMQDGINVFTSNNNSFSGNLISGNNLIQSNNGGFSISISGGNIFSGNTVTDNYPSVDIIMFSNYNIFYDNNFNDTIQLDSYSLSNTWYSAGEGNHWSDYTGHDRGDGIGKEAYNLTAGIRDPYPLMGEFSSFDATLALETYQVSLISNSTISDFGFEVGTETGNKIIHFNAAGSEDRVGFSRIAIPKGLMNNSVSVIVGGKEITPTLLNTQNTAFSYLYFTYPQNNQTILIISSKTMDLYNQLLDEFLTLNATYYGLLGNYTAQSDLLNSYTTQLGLLGNYTAQLQADLHSMNTTYNGLLSSYADMLGNYSQLQQSYSDLNASYQNHLSDYSQNLQNVRSLMYIFAAVSAILIVITVYFSKHAHSGPTEAPEERDRF